MKRTTMKPIRIIRLLRGAALVAAACGLFAACTEEPVAYNAGSQPDGEAIGTVSGTLRSAKSLRDRIPVQMTENAAEPMTDRIVYRLNQPAAQAVSVSVAADLSLVDTYNATNKTDLQPLPATAVTVGNGGALTVAAGKSESEPLEITFSADGLASGSYLLPLALQTDAETAEGQVLYYGITVRKFDENMMQQGNDIFKISLDSEWTTIFYVNTSEVQAHYADYVALETLVAMTFETVSRTSLGNIIVLRIAQVDYDAALQRVIFAPTSDLFYTLEHSDKYIAPMKDKGRKICVCIEGAGKGIGFCNMTDAQIADFVSQVKSFVETYDLDGVNLWDRGTGYGKEGMPAMNTTSYPKLIKAMREAMPDKMLTVVDHEEPTEYFWDTGATGGIAVGDYIDYAWHGYVSQDEPIVFCDPYNPSSMFPQVHPRKAIAGLDKNCYGTVNVPFYPERSDLAQDPTLELWMMNTIMWGLERTNNIIVFEDLALPQANVQEQGCIGMIGNYFMCLQYDEMFNEKCIYNVQTRIPNVYHGFGIEGGSGYNTFAKDW